MIEDEVVDHFTRHDIKWKMKGGREEIPTADDVEDALDEAAKQLYNEKPGTILQVGGLLFEKRANGYIDVYMYVGDYI